MKFTFGDIVVVDGENIGVVVKCWLPAINRPQGEDNPPNYDVYVRMENSIENYREDEIERYMVRRKYLSDEEKQWQWNAINNH